jgi:hypothetical protein
MWTPTALQGRSPFEPTFFSHLSLGIGQISLEQFTAAPNVVPHGSDLTQVVIDRSHRDPNVISTLTLKADQPCNSSASRRSMKLRSSQSGVYSKACGIAAHLPRGSTVNDLMCATLAPTDAASSLRACQQSAVVRRKERSQAC